MTSIAIIGIGNWGKNLIREFSNLGVEITCLNRGNEENIKWVRSNFPSVLIAKNYSEILDNEKIQGVVIATPINTHYEFAKRALDAGKNVFVEKPICEEIEDAEELMRLAKDKKKKLLVGHVFLYHPALKFLKDTLKEEAKNVSIEWNKFGTFKEDIILNLAVHSISIANSVLGKPTDLEIIEKQAGLTKTDILSFKMIYGDDSECFIRINRISSVKRHHITIMTDEDVYLWDDQTVYKLNHQKKEYEIVYKAEKSPLELECKDFVLSISEKKEPDSNGEIGLEVLKVATKLGDGLK